MKHEPSGLRVAMIGTRSLYWQDGGVEHAVAALTRELALRGHSVTVFARAAYLRDPPLPIEGATEVVVGHAHSKHLEAATHSALAATLASVPRSFDLIHFHAVGPSFFSCIPRVLGTPSVATVHALDWQRDKWSLPAKLALRGAGLVAAKVPHETIAVSRGIQQYLDSSYGAQSRYIPNGVDLDLGDVSPVDALRGERFFLFLGRLVPEKGVHTLIQAFRALDAKVRLAIVGSQSHSSDYQGLLRRLAVDDDRIIFLGSRHGPEKNWLLANAIGLVQPSTLEGLPIVLLEALAANLPILASDISPHTELLGAVGAQKARIFESDDVESLRGALASAIEAPGTAPEGVSVASTLRRLYSWPEIARETEAVYRDAIARAARGRRNRDVAAGEPFHRGSV